MEISSPIQKAVNTQPVPPEDISGRAIPFVGAVPVTTAIFINACRPIVAIMPKPINLAKGFMVWRIIESPHKSKPA